MRILLVSLLIGLGVVHTGSGDTQVKTLVHGGGTRSYRVHLPPSYRGRSPMALVSALHGFGDTAAGFEKDSDLSLLADREGFIAVYPDALPFGPKHKQMWNGGGVYEIWTRGYSPGSYPLPASCAGVFSFLETFSAIARH